MNYSFNNNQLNESSLYVLHNEIDFNLASNRGGAIFIENGVSVISGNDISENHGYDGGALYLVNGLIRLYYVKLLHLIYFYAHQIIFAFSEFYRIHS